LFAETSLTRRTSPDVRKFSVARFANKKTTAQSAVVVDRQAGQKETYLMNYEILRTWLVDLCCDVLREVKARERAEKDVEMERNFALYAAEMERQGKPVSLTGNNRRKR
jgi:hypothetical protein